MSVRPRLDLWLVDHGLVESRAKAQALIMAGEVRINGERAGKPSYPVEPDDRVELLARPRYVSRGGLKLEHALREFQVDPASLICADVGTSTGGFTDCLLQHGAARVHAVDTGSGQIDWRLRTDPRVVLHEGMNARFLAPGSLGEPVALAVCDVSFISLTLIIPAIVSILSPSAPMVLLVKPQFEVGRDQVGKGGIVRDPALHAAACDKVEAAVRMSGFSTRLIPSPITGSEGNREFLLYGFR